MVKFIFKRIGISIITVFVLATIAFFMIHSVPGGPFDADISEMSREAYENLRERYAIDQPLLSQYKLYIQNFLRGDWGESYQYTGVAVTQLIARGIGATAKLALFSVLVSVVIGFLLGITAALRPNTWIDNICMAISTIGISLPNYIVAVGLMYFFALKLRLLPVTGLATPSAYILPVIALALNPIANMAKLVKVSMIDALNQDYIIMARAKGLKPIRVIGIHALKNALLPTITYIAPMVAYLLMGSFVIENMFNIPGIGTMMATSIINRDYTVLTGMVIFYGTAVVACIILVDLAYMFVDPRVKYE